MQEFEAYQEITCFAFAWVKKNDENKPICAVKIMWKWFSNGIFCVLLKGRKQKIFADNHKYFFSLKGSEGPAGPQSTGNSRLQTNDSVLFVVVLKVKAALINNFTLTMDQMTMYYMWKGSLIVMNPPESAAPLQHF